VNVNYVPGLFNNHASLSTKLLLLWVFVLLAVEIQVRGTIY
jgi:hypothetical protein